MNKSEYLKKNKQALTLMDNIEHHSKIKTLPKHRYFRL